MNPLPRPFTYQIDLHHVIHSVLIGQEILHSTQWLSIYIENMSITTKLRTTTRFRVLSIKCRKFGKYLGHRAKDYKHIKHTFVCLVVIRYFKYDRKLYNKNKILKLKYWKKINYICSTFYARIDKPFHCQWLITFSIN